MKKYSAIGIVLVLLVGLGIAAKSLRTASVVPDTAQQKEKNIQVFSPQPGAVIGQPVVIVGVAREFENSFNYQILDNEDHVIASGYATAQAPDVGRYGAFSVALDYSFPKIEKGFVKVFAHSAKDGSEIDVVRIPISFVDRRDTLVKAYFDLPAMKESSDPSLVIEQCEGVYPVMRTVPQTVSVARAALLELLAGPSSSEHLAGYTTAINAGVELRSVVMNGAVITVDFSADFLREFGGSCRVGLVMDQLKSTLAQFPTIKEAAFLVEGKPNMIQP